ncbi:CapA family protein [Streptomyces spinosisporus]|jgi:poly-gamma-glutamate synthesis protein (capsule biosynthesis protein)|uniref:CapA family protein n=1 Tax=Streptomyces spinosisporus TaxID=2927582 RepID=A0ABS9XVN4_9ACTN|nr:CapA family protein [Streptomyces spinosisporus]MCI3244962.1 CapA family protein [Streptomyces spinosisporus]
MTTLLAVGDIILDEPDSDSFFEPSRSALRGADAVIGHVEVPHSTTTVSSSTDVPAPPADPAALGALSRAGFHAVTLAGNHIADAGAEGVLDTVRHARAHGLATAGAGPSLAEARQPALIRAGDRTVAVLSYNCVGPRESWATSAKPGCAYVHVLTHYELDHASPGGPPAIYTFANPDSLDAMRRDIEAARDRADIVVVGLHKGVGHTPAVLAMYERPLAQAAVDAGAHAVFAHHAHIMRGIEIHRGRPIYHGLGNFVTVTRALTPDGDNDSPERRAWAQRRVELYGFAPDPAMPYYPFHPESRNTVVARLDVDDQGEVRAGLLPCRIDDRGRPVPVTREAGGEDVVAYVRDISRRAGLTTRFDWTGDDLVTITQGDQR